MKQQCSGSASVHLIICGADPATGAAAIVAGGAVAHKCLFDQAVVGAGNTADKAVAENARGHDRAVCDVTGSAVPACDAADL